MIFQCPNCNTAVGELAAAGTQTLICGRCQFKYQVVSGTIVGSNSRQITLQRQSTGQAGAYERDYEFRLARPGGDVRVVSARIPGREDQFSSEHNDVISIVHAMRGDRTEDLVALVNQTTTRTLIVGVPGQKAGERASTIAFAAGLATLIVLAAAGAPVVVALIVGGFVCAALGAILPRKFEPRHALQPHEQTALLQTTSLLEQKAALAGRISQIEEDRREKMEVRDKLVALRNKMLAVGPDLYQTRIDRIASALPLLDRQIALDEELLGVSARMLTMVEIEIESASAARAIPDDVATDLEARAQELAALDARVSDLRLLLSANEEVERLLRGS